MSDAAGARAVYLVRWAPGRPQHDAAVAVSIGGWGGADPAARICFALDLRTLPEPAFMLVDATESPWGDDDGLLGRMLTREEALASPLKPEVFAVLDAAAEQDSRLGGWRLDAS